MTENTLHRTRTRHRGDDDNNVGDERERAAAGALAHRFAELGSPLKMSEAHELVSRLQRQGISELYQLALGQSVAIKRNRQQRREMRRATGTVHRG